MNIKELLEMSEYDHEGNETTKQAFSVIRELSNLIEVHCPHLDVAPVLDISHTTLAISWAGDIMWDTENNDLEDLSAKFVLNAYQELITKRLEDINKLACETRVDEPTRSIEP